MFKSGEHVIYKHDVCFIKDIKEIRGQKFYVLGPIEDESLTINISFEKATGLIRSIMSKKEVEEIIASIPEVEEIVVDNDKQIEQEYRRLLNNGLQQDLLRIIKTTYLRNENRLKANKKIGEKDNNYFKMAEKLLYNEFSKALNMPYDDVKEYVINKVETNRC